MSPRPKRNRQVESPPIVSGFIPSNGDYNPDDVVKLHIEEYESIRLIDYEGDTHLEASKKLDVSRPTLTRIYDSARKKVAMAFVENKCLSIEGGEFTFSEHWYHCNNCHSVFKTPGLLSGTQHQCPVCEENNIDLVQESETWNIRHSQMGRQRHAGGRGGRGVEGSCICPKCDLRIPHTPGVPCNSQLCPECNIRMIRENSEYHKTILKKRK